MQRDSNWPFGLALLLFIIGYGTPGALATYAMDLSLNEVEMGAAFPFALLAPAYFYRRFKPKYAFLRLLEEAESTPALCTIALIVGLLLGLISTLVVVLPIYWWLKWSIVAVMVIPLFLHELSASNGAK